MTHRPRVRDWASDFDHTDPKWVADPYPIWDGLRRECPVAHSDRYGGTAAREARAHRRGRIRHRALHVAVGRRERAAAGRRRSPAPIGVAADHVRPTVPRWAPPAPAAVRTEAGEGARAVHTGVVQRAARPDRRPARVRCRRRLRTRHRTHAWLSGEDADQFRHFIRLVLERVDATAEERQAQVDEGELDAYIEARISEHLEHPRDDLTTFLLDAELDGETPSRSRSGNDGAVDDRRDRHDMVRHRRAALASRAASRRPRSRPIRRSCRPPSRSSCARMRP